MIPCPKCGAEGRRTSKGRVPCLVRDTYCVVCRYRKPKHNPNRVEGGRKAIETMKVQQAIFGKPAPKPRPMVDALSGIEGHLEPEWTNPSE